MLCDAVCVHKCACVSVCELLQTRDFCLLCECVRCVHVCGVCMCKNLNIFVAEKNIVGTCSDMKINIKNLIISAHQASPFIICNLIYIYLQDQPFHKQHFHEQHCNEKHIISMSNTSTSNTSSSNISTHHFHMQHFHKQHFLEQHFNASLP